MAVWQYRFGLLPSQPLIELYGTLPLRVDAGDFDAAWRQQPPQDFTKLIDRFTSPYPSWSPDIRMWGAENGNRLHVVYEGGDVVEVACRLSLRDTYADFAAGVISLADDSDWILVLTSDAVALPKLEILLGAVAESNAAKFAKNPLEFIEGLSSGKYKPE